MSTLTLQFLGSGGAIRTPRPGCQCELCRGARTHGVPWARTGPSIFFHGPNVLIDTPEESAMQVDRAGITDIAAGFYSHWHPDHTAGRRMYETRNWDFRNWPPNQVCTPIYLPPQVADDFTVRLGLAENFAYLQSKGLVDVRLFDHPIDLGGWRITARPVAEAYVYLFLFEEIEVERDLPGKRGRRVLVCMDELFGWTPPADLIGVDLAVLPKGLNEFHPITGERVIPADHPVLQHEATFRQTLEMAETLQAKQLIFTHIEEPDQDSPPLLAQVAATLQSERGWDVTFAYDTLRVEL